jgi:hypothetical protein
MGVVDCRCHRRDHAGDAAQDERALVAVERVLYTHLRSFVASLAYLSRLLTAA